MRCIFPALIASIFMALPAIAQDKYSDDLLAVKKHFSDIEAQALAQVFQGIRSSGGKQQGLYRIRKTGVSTAPIVNAALAYLSLLSPPELIRTQYAVDDPEWRRWFNVDNGIYVRQGLSLKEMTSAQKSAAMNILGMSLSAKGMELSRSIMKTDKTLSELNNNSSFLDEELYFITIMGTPSETEPWGWQLDGHHLVINYFILGDQVVMTPTFLGAEPAVTTSGKYTGNEVLQGEQDLGLAFMRSLTTSQQAAATLQANKLMDNMVAAAHEDNLVLDFAGLQTSAMNEEQRQELVRLASLFVNNMNEGHAKIRMAEIQKHIPDTWFSWAGGTRDDSVFYYRIHSPVVLIEFDHQRPVGSTSLHDPGKPTRDHIHVVIRTPNGNDYGKDLLGQHLAKHAH